MPEEIRTFYQMLLAQSVDSRAERFAWGPDDKLTIVAQWKFGTLKGGGIRICDDCGSIDLEDEMHLCKGTRDA